MKKPKFNIGDKVYSKVTVRGSYEPSVLNSGEVTYIDGIRRWGSSYMYTCGYDGYEIEESNLMSKEEYIKSLP